MRESLVEPNAVMKTPSVVIQRIVYFAEMSLFLVSESGNPTLMGKIAVPINFNEHI
jgi:hypothetical protein